MAAKSRRLVRSPGRGGWPLGRNKSRKDADMLWSLTLARASATEQEDRQMRPRWYTVMVLLVLQCFFIHGNSVACNKDLICTPLLTQVMSDIKSLSGHICNHSNHVLPMQSGEFKSQDIIGWFSNAVYAENYIPNCCFHGEYCTEMIIWTIILNLSDTQFCHMISNTSIPTRFLIFLLGWKLQLRHK